MSSTYTPNGGKLIAPNTLRSKKMNMHRLSTFALLVSMAALALMPVRGMAAHTVPVTVTITRVEALVTEPDEGLEALGEDTADLYAVVEINGSSQSSFDAHVDDAPLIEPFWNFSTNVAIADDANPGSVSVVIQIWDHDDTSPDDKADADPGGGKDVDLVVDLTTGSWSGDAAAPAKCSTGTGDEGVRVCWEIGLVSAGNDADGDGLLDGWEINGLDANGDGTIDVDLPAFGANPLHKDLFLELDVTPGQAPSRAGIQAMKVAFAAAPLTNPDGQPGVNLWVDTGGLSDNTASEDLATPGSCGDGIDNGGDGLKDSLDPDCLVGDNLGGGNPVPALNNCGLDSSPFIGLMPIFYDTKFKNFNRNRRWAFRYAISTQKGSACPTGGQGEIGGNDFIEYNHDGGTIMHELGHNLNLHHGGSDDANCKPNYVSVMDYDEQFGIQQAGGGTILDYSPPRFVGGRGQAPLMPLVEVNLNEATILDPTDSTNRFVFVNGQGQKVQSPLNQPVDWDGDGNTTGAGISVNIDTSGAKGRPAACTNPFVSLVPLFGNNDWAQVSLPFRQFGDSADSAINPVTEQEPTLQDLLILQKELNTTDLALSISDTPDPVAAGTQLIYTLTVTNNGPNPASSVQVVDTLPSDISYASSTANCKAVASIVTCDLGEILAGTAKVVAITVNVPADLVYNNGGPKTITNSAAVSNLAGPDPKPANDSDSESTLVVAVADLEIASFETVGAPLEVLIGKSVDITLKKVIANQGPSSPMDVQLIRTATASTGATITPATASSTETALAVGVPRIVNEVFTVTCFAPGPHTFSFTNQIAPKNAADTDPDLSNNAAEIELTVDCVVPVAINIKPHGYPNSVSLSKGDIPVAALTTVAGEYGLPLAFDAVTIDPLSVRFGPEALVFNVATPGGAPESHNMGHLEDSYELDEKTRDGDIDMVLHFPGVQTGLTPSDTKACVKGTFTDPATQMTYKFLGCDAIVVRP